MLQNWLSLLTNSIKRFQVSFPNFLLPNQAFTNPYYRFQSYDELQLAVQMGIRIDVNRATVDDWLRLPGLSIHQAHSLVNLVQTGVELYCLEDLAAVLGVPTQTVKPLEPILQFCYYDGENDQTVKRINPNVATIAMLTQIPQIDLFLARTIIQNRQQFGPYLSIANFQARLSLPNQLTATLVHYLMFKS